MTEGLVKEHPALNAPPSCGGRGDAKKKKPRLREREKI
jgi:hypothetical protein